VATDFIADSADVRDEPRTPESTDSREVSPAPAADRPVRALAPRGSYRQIFLTVWRGVADEPSSFVHAPADVRSAVGQRERCPDTGRIHEHYWLVFTRPLRPSSVERFFNPPLVSGEGGDYHGEAVWGTNDAVHRYCTKRMVFLVRL